MTADAPDMFLMDVQRDAGRTACGHFSPTRRAAPGRSG